MVSSEILSQFVYVFCLFVYLFMCFVCLFAFVHYMSEYTCNNKIQR
jgi:hypothetical protein